MLANSTLFMLASSTLFMLASSTLFMHRNSQLYQIKITYQTYHTWSHQYFSDIDTCHFSCHNYHIVLRPDYTCKLQVKNIFLNKKRTQHLETRLLPFLFNNSSLEYLTVCLPLHPNMDVEFREWYPLRHSWHFPTSINGLQAQWPFFLLHDSNPPIVPALKHPHDLQPLGFLGENL